MIPSETLQVSQLKNPAVSLTEWDNFVASVKNGHILQTTPWAAYRQKVGWNPILLSLSNQGSLQAGCLVLQRSPAGLPFAGVLYVPRGPVLDYDSPEAPRLLSVVLDRLMQLARRQFALVRISPDVKRTTTWVEEMLLEKNFHIARVPIQHTATFRLDLTPPLDQIIARVKPRQRTYIRKYERDKGAWSFHCGDPSDDLNIFYTLYHKTIISVGKNAKSINDLWQMHENLSPSGSSFIFIVKYKDRPVAGALNVAVGKRMWYFYGGSTKDVDVNGGAGLVLHWEIIKWAKNQGYKEYDLQGIPDPPVPGDPLYGVYRFKRIWGGELVRLLGEYDFSSYPFLKRIIEWKLARL